MLLLNEMRIAPDSNNNDGNTPMHLACANRKFDIVQLVRNARCDPVESNNRGDTALHSVCRGICFRLGEAEGHA